MCAIVGFIGYVREGQWGETHSILRELLVAAQHRGRDATGFVAHTAPYDAPLKQQLIVAKEPVPASRFVMTNGRFRRLRHTRCGTVLAHVRAATHGEPADNANNHPHCGGDFSLVHNGIVSNYRELAIKYNLKLKSECDSEVLLRLVEREREPAAGLRRCLREITGSAAIALHDRRTGLVWLARNNGRPLWMMRLLDDRRVFLASTAEILLTALRIVLGPRVTRSIQFMMPLPEGTPVALSATGLMVAPTVALE